MMAWLSLWWVWVCAALLLGLVELLAPAFIFLGFSLAALIMGGVAWLGLMPSTTFASFALYAILALASWVGLKMAFKTPTGSVKTFESDIND